MKISLKLEYACRVMAQISRTYGSGKLAHIEELSIIEAIPQNYLVQILNDLRTGGLLLSRRGKQGGYKLAKPPADISLHAVVTAIDPELLSSKVSLHGQSGAIVSEVWNDLSNKLKKNLQKTSLASLIPRYNAGMMYDI
ncbi:MAG: Rrf2 family transcriptional regulator [Puniceicoccales bacterium]|jgi:Rrf2 family protein|nr:Rrf2 family transcriptional regulator [Puniceicoccales bacterium]